MKRAIVSGGAGFVGSALVKELLAHGVEVFVFDIPGYLQSPAFARLRGLDAHLYECDIHDVFKLPEMIAERGFDAWYQLSWDGLRGDALVDYNRQIGNIKCVLDAIVVAAQMGCGKFVGSGSVAQYELQVPQGQAAVNDKHKVYKTAKLCSEYMGRSVAADHGIPFIWPIITNIYGVGESSPRLVNAMIRNLLAGKRQALSEGNQIYDFIYVTDAAKAFRLIGEKGKENRVYTIAQGSAQPLKNFLATLRDVVAPDAELGFGELAFNGIYLPAEYYDTTALKEDTGFTPDVSFEHGVRLTAEWIKAEAK